MTDRTPQITARLYDNWTHKLDPAEFERRMDERRRQRYRVRIGQRLVTALGLVMFCVVVIEITWGLR